MMRYHQASICTVTNRSSPALTPDFFRMNRVNSAVSAFKLASNDKRSRVQCSRQAIGQVPVMPTDNHGYCGTVGIIFDAMSATVLEQV